MAANSPPKPTVSYTNMAEVNALVDALQDKVSSLTRARDQLAKTSPGLCHMMDRKLAITKVVLDRARSEWKKADPIPPEVMAAMMEREDKRFWVKRVGLCEETFQAYHQAMNRQ